MKTLVTFYSRTENTRKIGEEIAKKIESDTDEIIDAKKRHGPIRWILAGKDAMRKKLTDIAYQKDPSKYELVIIGTPIWAFTMSPAVRTYLTINKFKEVAFFITYGGSEKNVFSDMQELSKKPIATMRIIDKNVKNDSYKEELEGFYKELNL